MALKALGKSPLALEPERDRTASAEQLELESGLLANTPTSALRDTCAPGQGTSVRYCLLSAITVHVDIAMREVQVCGRPVGLAAPYVTLTTSISVFPH